MMERLSYIGVNGGVAEPQVLGSHTAVLVGRVFVPPALKAHDATGATVGGQIGYRWQSAAWVFGLEAEGNWADFQG